MQEQLSAQKRGKRNKENLRRTVDVLAVATTQINQTKTELGHLIGVYIINTSAVIDTFIDGLIN